ncbi:mRNA splicing protein [Borealophlyctis nickersoniae]|nr:mRNA splicing protein [Borealophlyctis nickersoniae]
MASSQTQKLSREDFKKQKIIEEQRKAGTLPAEVDPETGRDINPHIPHYISQAPWYLDINHATLKHQRAFMSKDKQDSLNEWYARGVRAGPAATKFRKGACENCGAMTHKTKDCLERPRKTGAKWTGKDIQADEMVQDFELGFEAKRDRWNGYDPQEHVRLIEEWEVIDEKRRQIREQQVKEKHEAARKAASGEGQEKAVDDIKVEKGTTEGAVVAATVAGGESDEDEDEDKYADRADMVGQKLDTKSRTTVRNLRIREDTAKYLLNLDVNSAYYDPKTRSMRDNPLKEQDPQELTYAGDNFQRWTGDAPKMGRLQQFAWEAESRGKDVHLQANPTQGELLFKQYQEKKSKLSETVKGSILERYGGEEHLQAPPKELLLAQSEHYVEYSQTGRVIKGQEKAAVKSKYEEDVYVFNHTAVWGSWWKAGRWGYACCHTYLRNAYCTGQAGIEAEQAAGQLLVEGDSEPAEPKKTLLQQHLLKAGKSLDKANEKDKKAKKRGERLGEGDVELDKAKLAKALEAEKKRKAEEDEAGLSRKKGKYFSNEEVKDVTEEELEAYRLVQRRADDPMANYVDDD